VLDKSRTGIAFICSAVYNQSRMDLIISADPYTPYSGEIVVVLSTKVPQ
jgi:hypothetical protein